MAFSRNAGFVSAIATNAADTAAGLLTPDRHNLAHTVTDAVAGAIPWFSGTGTESVSALLAANALVIGGGAGAAPFTSANLTFSATLVNSGPGLQVGSGSTTSAGLQIGYAGTSGYGAIYPTSVTPTTSNYILSANSLETYIRGPNQIQFVTTDGVRLGVYKDSASASVEVTAGTTTTDRNALLVTQTWNASGVTFTHEKHVITDTASAAGSLALQYLGGASGTTNLLKLDKTGLVTTVAVTATGYLTSDQIIVGATGALYWSGRSLVRAPVDGVIAISDLAETKIAYLSPISTNLLGIGTGAAGSFAGGLKLTTLTLDGLAITKGYTVATLPAGVTGGICHVTDQLTAVNAKGVAPTGGGAVVCAQIYNGAAWVGI